jgi:hypothetical protein
MRKTTRAASQERAVATIPARADRSAATMKRRTERVGGATGLGRSGFMRFSVGMLDPQSPSGAAGE